MAWDKFYQSQFLRVDPERGRFQVNRAAYADPDVFKQEKKLIFDRTWQVIGHESEIKKPGDFIRRETAGRRLIFLRDHTGKPTYVVFTDPNTWIDVARLRELQIPSIAIFAGEAFLSGYSTLLAAFSYIKEHSDLSPDVSRVKLKQFSDFIGFPGVAEMEQKYLPEELAHNCREEFTTARAKEA